MKINLKIASQSVLITYISLLMSCTQGYHIDTLESASLTGPSALVSSSIASAPSASGSIATDSNATSLSTAQSGNSSVELEVTCQNLSDYNHKIDLIQAAFNECSFSAFRADTTAFEPGQVIENIKNTQLGYYFAPGTSATPSISPIPWSFVEASARDSAAVAAHPYNLLFGVNLQGTGTSGDITEFVDETHSTQSVNYFAAGNFNLKLRFVKAGIECMRIERNQEGLSSLSYKGNKIFEEIMPHVQSSNGIVNVTTRAKLYGQMYFTNSASQFTSCSQGPSRFSISTSTSSIADWAHIETDGITTFSDNQKNPLAIKVYGKNAMSGRLQ